MYIKIRICQRITGNIALIQQRLKFLTKFLRADLHLNSANKKKFEKRGGLKNSPVSKERSISSKILVLFSAMFLSLQSEEKKTDWYSVGLYCLYSSSASSCLLIFPSERVSCLSASPLSCSLTFSLSHPSPTFPVRTFVSFRRRHGPEVCRSGGKLWQYLLFMEAEKLHCHVSCFSAWN